MLSVLSVPSVACALGLASEIFEFARQDVLDPEGFVKGIADLIRSGKSVGFRRMTHSDARWPLFRKT